MAEKRLKGVPASGGIAIGPAYLYQPQGLNVPRRSLKAEEVEGEVDRFHEARKKTRAQISKLAEVMKAKLGEEHAGIFRAHEMVLEDPLFLETIPDSIRKRRLNCEHLVSEALDRFKSILISIDDPYFRERGADIQDVADRVLRNLTGEPRDRLRGLDREVIVIAHDVTPSDTADMAPERVKGFSTEVGGARPMWQSWPVPWAFLPWLGRWA